MQYTKPKFQEGEFFLDDVEEIVNAIPVPGSGITVTQGNVWNASSSGSSSGIAYAWTQNGSPGKSTAGTGLGYCFLTVIRSGVEYIVEDKLTEFRNRFINAVGPRRLITLSKDGNSYILLVADCDESTKPPLLPQEPTIDPDENNQVIAGSLEGDELENGEID